MFLPVMRLNPNQYLRYTLKTARDTRKLFEQESEELHLSSRFKSLLGPFVPKNAKQVSADPPNVKRLKFSNSDGPHKPAVAFGCDISWFGNRVTRPKDSDFLATDRAGVANADDLVTLLEATIWY